MTDKKKADQQASPKETPAHHSSTSCEDLSKISRSGFSLLDGIGFWPFGTNKPKQE